METFETKNVLSHNQELKAAQTISLFVINIKNEMLLCKKTSDSDLLKTPWQPPSFLYHNSSEKPTHIAQQQINQMGMTCQLYEAFTLNDLPVSAHEAAPFSNHLIIALVNRYDELIISTTETYKWITVNEALQAIHDHPEHYAPWLGTVLESVQLYVKDIIKNQPFGNVPTHFECQ